MKRIISIQIIILSFVSIVSCERIEPEYPEYHVSDPVPLSLTRTQQEYLEKGDTLAFNLLDLIAQKADGKDFFFSPLSVQMALSMLLNGTDGEAFDELCNVLGYGEDLPSVNDFCKQIIERTPTWYPNVRLSFANAMVGNNKYSFKAPYVNTLKNIFSAEVKNMDFSKPNEVLKYINNWSNKKTYGMIPKILDHIDSKTAFALMNALYFEGSWSSPFNKADTKKESFHCENGKTVKVFMMNQHFDHTYCFVGANWKSFSLNYKNSAFKMRIFLPDENTSVQTLINQIKAYGYSRFIQSSASVNVNLDLKLPRFEANYSEDDFAKHIYDLGAHSLFKGGSLSKISDSANGSLSVIHKARIKVDEEGSVAAATTAVTYITSPGVYEQHIDFFCDRPFLYIIEDNHSGLILFIGKYGGNN